MSESPTIVLCPGQGAQHVGMGRAWAQKSSAARAVFDAADAALGFSLSSVCFEGPEDRVNRTDVAQAAIYTTSIAAWRGLIEAGAVKPEDVTATGGLSLGEYTALHLAGVFSFEAGLRLVEQRGRFMQEAAEASDSSMVALIGVEELQAQELCDAARGDDVLVPANFNCPGQIVISGSSAACDRAVTEAASRGWRATALTVAGAFHSPLMQPAADRMAEALAAVEFAAPKIPVMSNVTGEVHGQDVNVIRDLLVKQITHSVRWEQDMRWLVANRPGRYIELAPGKVLMGLMRRTDRGIKVENFAEPNG